MIRSPDRDNAALLLVDLQVASVGACDFPEGRDVAAAAGLLRDVAELHGLPVVITAGSLPGDGGELVGPLAGRGPAPIERTAVDAFAAAEVADAIAETGRPVLLVAGVALDIGVTAAALSARARGLDVLVVEEACATTDADARDAARSRLDAAGVPRIGIAALARTLAADFTDPRMKRVQELLSSC